MLIEFTVGNFRSFKDKQTLYLEAAGAVSEHKDQLITTDRHKLLRSVAIYGANASGKSNLLRACASMLEMLFNPQLHSSIWELPVEPFLLDDLSEKSPSFFEIVFLLDGIRYRYGFEASRKRFEAEWLYEAKKEREKLLFVRELDEIKVHSAFEGGKGLEKRTKPNSPFLLVCDQFNVKTAMSIIKWLNGWRVINNIEYGSKRFRDLTLDLLNMPAYKSQIVNFLKRSDLSIDDIVTRTTRIQDNDITELHGDRPVYIKTIHKKYQEDGTVSGAVELNLSDNESSGTNKLFDLAGQIFTCLNRGTILLIDEMDAKLHPLLTRAIIRLFNLPETNPNNAQLIFTTHDTNLLTYGGFRRDQVYFTEKNKVEATNLYSLAEFKEEKVGKVRKDRSFEKDYMQGRYGAIPYLQVLDNIQARVVNEEDIL
jgi:AAA15 family ATPase/GTPase